MWKLDAYHHPLPPEERAAGELGVPFQFASNGALQLYQVGPDFSSPNALIILQWQAEATQTVTLIQAVMYDEPDSGNAAIGQAPGVSPTPQAESDKEAATLLVDLAGGTLGQLIDDVSDSVADVLDVLGREAAGAGINLSLSRTEGYLAQNDTGAKPGTRTDATADNWNADNGFRVPAYIDRGPDGVDYLVEPSDDDGQEGYKSTPLGEEHLEGNSGMIMPQVLIKSTPVSDTSPYRDVKHVDAPAIDYSRSLLNQELKNLYGGDDLPPTDTDTDASWLADAGAPATSDEASSAPQIVPPSESGTNEPPSDGRQFFSGLLEGIPQFVVGMAESVAKNFVYGIPGVGILYAGYELYKGAEENGGGIRGAFVAANEQWNPLYGGISAAAGLIKAVDDKDARKAGNQAFHLAVGIVAAVDLVRGGLKGSIEETVKKGEEGPTSKIKKDDIVDSSNASSSKARSVRSLSDRLAEHRAKLEAYKANPDAFDNKGFLKNAPSQAVRENIIKGRINHLEQEIRNFENQIEDLGKNDGR